MNGTPWTPIEDAKLKRLFEVERKSSTEIAEFLPGRTLAAIQSRIQVLNLQWPGLRTAWAPERDELLRQLWCVEGLSASKIAKRMPGLTSNAVIGRVHRLGLVRADRGQATRAQQHIKPPRAERRPSRPRNMLLFGNFTIEKSSAPSPAFEPVKETAGDPVTLLDRAPHQCGWPVSDGNPFLFCGAPKSGHKRYCDRHARAGLARGRAVA